ncbi:MAG: signal peptidase I [Patescibacteria group bacterium]|jgi:signal peptidase
MKILRIIYYLFIAVIIIIALLLVVSIFSITGNFKVMVVQSGSMEPAIHTGSIVVAKPAAEYKQGDIISFGKASKTKASVTHRINEIKEVNGVKSYVTKGDANNAPDLGETAQSEIIGKVLFSVPYAGYAVDTAKKPFGFMLIIVIPAVIIIYDELRKVKDEIIKIRAKKKEAKYGEKIKKESGEEAKEA